jgi:hypothetical protein
LRGLGATSASALGSAEDWVVLMTRPFAGGLGR